jgi:DNA-binding CsgD family transcriptional regulator
MGRLNSKQIKRQNALAWEREIKKPLSAKEKKIIKLIWQTNTTAEIAAKMKLSPRTIEGYRNIIMAKTKSKNVVALIRYALKKKLVK